MTTLALLASALLVAACNTVHGMGEDARSVGRVFSHDSNGDHRNR
ncbi:entericidin EcnAB [Sphingomonas abietis]|nr:entericidin EcnAB [Sphingomonas abietis]